MIDQNTGSGGGRVILYASGSNSHGQLGVIINNDEDIKSFDKCWEWNPDTHYSQNDDNDTSQEENRQEPNFSISSSLGGRHSMFLLKSKYRNETSRSYTSLCSCGDSSQRQIATEQTADSSSTSKNDICFEPLSLSSPSFTSSKTSIKPLDSNQNSQNDRHETLKKMDYKNLISKVSNITQDLKKKLLKNYQPVQVAACWETSFIVLSHVNYTAQSNKALSNDNPEINDEGEEPNSHDDCIVAFGSHDFDLRGTNNSLKDRINPNLVDLPTSQSTINTRRKIKLFSGCKHLIAIILHVSDDGHCFQIKFVGWGAARHGQLGPIENYPQLPRSIKPTFLSISIPTMSDYSSIKVALGNQHTVIACSTRIWCWGSNRNNQIPPQLQNLPPIAILELQASWNATFVLTSADRPGFKKLLGYGNNLYGQLGVQDRFVSHVERLIEASYSGLCAGSEHVLITKGDHQVWGWGWNEHGNLGKENGGEIQHSRPFELVYQTVEDQRVVHVAAGCATSFIFCQK